MDLGNPGAVADASQTNATSRRAKKRRRGSSPQEETSEEISRSKRKPTRSSQPTPPLFPPVFPLLPPSQPGGGTAYPTIGPISIVQYPYPSTTRHQPSFPPPSVVWSPIPTTPVTVHGGISTCTEQTKGPITSPSRNHELASVGFEEQPGGTSLPVNSSSGSQPHPDSGATNNRPRLEDLPDPRATQRPSPTIRVLASAALRSEPKGRLTLEEIVDRICSRFEYFQDLRNRAKLKVATYSSLVGYNADRDDRKVLDMRYLYIQNLNASKIWKVVVRGRFGT